MKGPEIRAALHDQRLLLLKHSTGCKVVDEVGIPWNVVADVLVCNGALWGYEIKGETDSLKRLAAQAKAYGNVFERCYLVGAPRHIRAASKLLPSWWGLIETRGGELVEMRQPEKNTEWDATAVLGMLWRPELEALLLLYGETKGVSRLTAAKMAERLAPLIERPRLQRIVADQIVARLDWGRNRVNPA